MISDDKIKKYACGALKTKCKKIFLYKVLENIIKHVTNGVLDLT